MRVNIRITYDKDQKPVTVWAACDCGWMVFTSIHSADLVDIFDASELHLMIAHDIPPDGIFPPIDHYKRHDR